MGKRRANMMNPMNGMMMMPMMGPGMYPPDESSDEDRVATTRRRRDPAPEPAPVPAEPGPVAGEGTLKLMEPISRAHAFVASLSLERVSQQLELLTPLFDSTMTCDLTKPGVLMLAWIVTRVKPNIAISSLRHLP